MLYVEKYMSLIYHNYDSMMYKLPTGTDASISILKLLIEDLEKGKNILFLVQNDMFSNLIFNTFSNLINMELSLYSINTYYQHDNGSVIFFRTFYNVQKQLFNDIDNIVLFNITLNRNNEQTLELINNIKKANKKIFINCNFRFNVKDVILRRLGRKKFYYKDLQVLNQDKMLDEINIINLDIRNKKLKKLKEKIL